MLAAFHRDGFVLVPGVLSPGEIATLREVTDRCFADPALQGSRYLQGFILRNTLELDPVFVDVGVNGRSGSGGYPTPPERDRAAPIRAPHRARSLRKALR